MPPRKKHSRKRAHRDRGEVHSGSSYSRGVPSLREPSAVRAVRTPAEVFPVPYTHQDSACSTHFGTNFDTRGFDEEPEQAGMVNPEKWLDYQQRERHAHDIQRYKETRAQVEMDESKEMEQHRDRQRQVTSKILEELQSEGMDEFMSRQRAQRQAILEQTKQNPAYQQSLARCINYERRAIAKPTPRSSSHRSPSASEHLRRSETRHSSSESPQPHEGRRREMSDDSYRSRD